jgi:hypothetical protein
MLLADHLSTLITKESVTNDELETIREEAVGSNIPQLSLNPF